LYLKKRKQRGICKMTKARDFLELKELILNWKRLENKGGAMV
jgi:hypothetical protein